MTARCLAHADNKSTARSTDMTAAVVRMEPLPTRNAPTLSTKRRRHAKTRRREEGKTGVSPSRLPSSREQSLSYCGQTLTTKVSPGEMRIAAALPSLRAAHPSVCSSAPTSHNASGPGNRCRMMITTLHLRDDVDLIE